MKLMSGTYEHMYDTAQVAIWYADPTGRHDIATGRFAEVASRIASDHRAVVESLREAARVVDARTERGTFPEPTPQKQGILLVIEDDLEATQRAVPSPQPTAHRWDPTASTC